MRSGESRLQIVHPFFNGQMLDIFFFMRSNFCSHVAKSIHRLFMTCQFFVASGLPTLINLLPGTAPCNWCRKFCCGQCDQLQILACSFCKCSMCGNCGNMTGIFPCKFGFCFDCSQISDLPWPRRTFDMGIDCIIQYVGFEHDEPFLDRRIHLLLSEFPIVPTKTVRRIIHTKRQFSNQNVRRNQSQQNKRINQPR